MAVAMPDPAAEVVAGRRRGDEDTSRKSVLGRRAVLVINIGKGSFIKTDMPGDQNMICGEVQAPIAFVVCGITEKDTFSGTRREFVVGSGGEVGIAMTTKHSKVLVGRRCTEQLVVRGEKVDRLRRKAVQQISGRA